MTKEEKKEHHRKWEEDRRRRLGIEPRPRLNMTPQEKVQRHKEQVRKWSRDHYIPHPKVLLMAEERARRKRNSNKNYRRSTKGQAHLVKVNAERIANLLIPPSVNILKGLNWESCEYAAKRQRLREEGLIE